MDQSSTLRKMAAQRGGAALGKKSRSTHIFSVTSGKGGVGKSNFVINVAIALRQRNKRVLIMDADMGLANIDILIGMTSQYNISHVLTGEKNISEVISEGPMGIHVLPASSGVEWMANLTADQKLAFLQKMDALNGIYDILLIDTGAGISSNVTYFNLAAQTRVVMVTPEPTSLTDAYALIKVLHRSYHQKDFEVVVNCVRNEKEGLDVYRNLTTVADRFLDVRLGYLGHVELDEHLRRSVLRQTPVVLAFPDEQISRSYRAVAKRLGDMPTNVMGSELGVFWRNVMEPSANS